MKERHGSPCLDRSVWIDPRRCTFARVGPARTEEKRGPTSSKVRRTSDADFATRRGSVRQICAIKPKRDCDPPPIPNAATNETAADFPPKLFSRSKSNLNLREGERERESVFPRQVVSLTHVATMHNTERRAGGGGVWIPSLLRIVLHLGGEGRRDREERRERRRKEVRGPVSRDQRNGLT